MIALGLYFISYLPLNEYCGSVDAVQHVNAEINGIYLFFSFEYQRHESIGEAQIIIIEYNI